MLALFATAFLGKYAFHRELGCVFAHAAGGDDLVQPPLSCKRGSALFSLFRYCPRDRRAYKGIAARFHLQ